MKAYFAAIVVSMFIFFCCKTNYAIGQEANHGFSFSAKTGLTLANMYGPDVESETFLNGGNPNNFYANHPANSHFKPGVNIGLSADYHFNKHISLGLGSSFIQKGCRVAIAQHWNSETQKYETINGTVNWNQNFFTFELPLTYFLPLRNNDLYVQAGLFVGLLINSTEVGKISIDGTDYNYTKSRRASKTEPGYFIGVGYMYALPDKLGKIFTEISWSRSILVSPGSDMIPNPQYYYNQTLSLNIGYRFGSGIFTD